MTFYNWFKRHVASSAHSFDLDERRKDNPKRKSGRISSFRDPGKGAEGVRVYHKSNEERILPHRRMDINDEDLFPT